MWVREHYPMLITSDPANIHYILSKNFSNFTKGPDFKKIFDTLGDEIFNAKGESWENQRKTAMSLMNPRGFHEFVASITWEKVEHGLIPILDIAAKIGEKVDLQDLFQRLTFDTTCITVLGHDPVSLCIDLPHMRHEKAFADAEEAALYRYIRPEIFWKLEKWLQIGKEKKLAEAKETLHQFEMHCISLQCQKVKAMDENEDYSLLTGHMRAWEKASDENVLKNIMLNIVFAGREMISAALMWFFWLLAKNPIEENKIRQEITTNLQLHEYGQWKFSSIEELNKLVYLHGALCETLRLYPPVPLQHKAPIKSNVLTSGHKIKPNTKTILAIYSMGRTESIWENIVSNISRKDGFLNKDG